MTQAIIQYAFDPSFVLGVQNVQDGANVVLLERSKIINPSLFVWDINSFSQYITLQATLSSPTPLVLNTPSCSSQTLLTVSNRKTGNNNQKWTFFGSTTFILSVGCQGMLVDDKNRVLQDGNPIWLYPNNGSPAQQWILSTVMMADVEEARSSFEAA